jgi:hypothetical protein
MDNQYRAVKKAFYNEPKSRFMLAIETEVPIQNVCRYVDMLRDLNQIAIARMDYCKITNQLVEYLTTDPEDFPENNQLELFE